MNDFHYMWWRYGSIYIHLHKYIWMIRIFYVKMSRYYVAQCHWCSDVADSKHILLGGAIVAQWSRARSRYYDGQRFETHWGQLIFPCDFSFMFTQHARIYCLECSLIEFRIFGCFGRHLKNRGSRITTHRRMAMVVYVKECCSPPYTHTLEAINYQCCRVELY